MVLDPRLRIAQWIDLRPARADRQGRERLRPQPPRRSEGGEATGKMVAVRLCPHHAAPVARAALNRRSDVEDGALAEGDNGVPRANGLERALERALLHLHAGGASPARPVTARRGGDACTLLLVVHCPTRVRTTSGVNRS